MDWKHWLEDSGIEAVDIQFLRMQHTASVVKVVLCGKYLVNDQHKSSRVLRMAVAAALAWTEDTLDGLLLDLTDLEYFGGDTLLGWDHMLNGVKPQDPPIMRVAFVCNDTNSQHVRSLLEEMADEEWMQWFREEAEAISFLAGAS